MGKHKKENDGEKREIIIPLIRFNEPNKSGEIFTKDTQFTSPDGTVIEKGKSDNRNSFGKWDGGTIYYDETDILKTVVYLDSDDDNKEGIIPEKWDWLARNSDVEWGVDEISFVPKRNKGKETNNES